MSKLPKNWRAVIDEPSGRTLYWVRCCGRYLVMQTGGGQFDWEFDNRIMDTVHSLTEALLCCREHMHEQALNNVSAEQAKETA